MGKARPARSQEAFHGDLLAGGAADTVLGLATQAGTGNHLRYWWVNQNETFRHEVGGGYLWSPKKTKAGRNQFYDNMLEVQPGDLVLSFADTFIKAIGVATSRGYSSPKLKVFGQTGEYWSDEGWKVDVEFTYVDNPIRPKDNMKLISP